MTTKSTFLRGLVLCLLALGLAGAAHADDAKTQELAKASQNPLAKLISVPLENNFYFGLGPSDSNLFVLNMKPVLPLTFGKVNLINRFIIPVMWAEGQEPGDLPSDIDLGYASRSAPFTGTDLGLGDITYTAFFSPAQSGKVLWGVGPVLVLPTATSIRFGSEQWSAGLSFVALTMPGKWVLGVLVQNVWSFAGDEDRNEVNKFLGQYFINYNLDKGWYLSTTPIITANWESDSGQRWTVPFGGGVGRMVRFGKLPVDLKLAGYWNAIRPDNSPGWSLQFTIKFLFPKGR